MTSFRRTRTERIARLTEQDRFHAGDDSPLGLVKVANRAVAKKKKAAKQQDEQSADEPAATTE